MKHCWYYELNKHYPQIHEGRLHLRVKQNVSGSHTMLPDSPGINMMVKANKKLHTFLNRKVLLCFQQGLVNNHHS